MGSSDANVSVRFDDHRSLRVRTSKNDSGKKSIGTTQFEYSVTQKRTLIGGGAVGQ
jgi:hypothetical protein